MTRDGKPLVIELFCGTFGWSQGWLEIGGRAIGFDIEHMPHHGPVPDGAELVIQDVLTLDGRQFRNSDLILASPPCIEFSYMAMPWKRAKQIAAALRGQGEFPAGYTGSRTLAQLTALFDACFRIQREACEAAGRYIPMVLENVRGAQPWVGRAKANFGSFYLWGDVAMVGKRVVCRPEFGSGTKPMKGPMKSTGEQNSNGELYRQGINKMRDAFKVPGFNFHEFEKTGKSVRSFQTAAVKGNGGGWFGDYSEMKNKQPIWFNDDKRRADKCGGDWFGAGVDCSLMRQMGSKSSARKAASAQIAKIPMALSAYVARSYKPAQERTA